MKSCKECIHYDVCCDWTSKDAIDATDVAMANGEVAICNHFKSTADVTEVRHGWWVHNPVVCSSLYCSECGAIGNGDNYCSRCGAKMDGGSEEQTSPEARWEKNMERLKSGGFDCFVSLKRSFQSWGYIYET